MNRFVWITIALLATAAFALPQRTARSRSSIAPPSDDSVTAHENIAYATINGSDLHLDVYEPADRGAGPRAAVLLFHGGGWTSYDKSGMRDFGEFLARSGYIAVAVDYRLFTGPENRWPAQLDDAQRSVRWVRANADKYNVDRRRIGAFGFSAGAQIACLLGMEDTRDNSDPALAKYSSRVQAVVDFAGPTDFPANHDPEDDAFLTKFFGADYAKNPEVWRDASPVFHVSKKTAPFLIVHGTKDQNVPMSDAKELYDKLKAAKVPVTFVKVDDSHNLQTPEAQRTLTFETRDFFDRYLANSP